ncbi:MAG: hypothetical protein QNJ82_06590 [Gammaproteobacteria bacterium]|nr:hypothetical protein [Gammaproteobacteria bacterium]
MSIGEVLVSPQLAGAFLGYAVLSVLGALAGARLHASLESDAGHWLWQHVYAPQLRAASLLIFLFMAYPTLYGLTDAPSVVQLLKAEEGRFGHILGVTFVLSLALPMLPVIGAIPALVLPVQGAVAAALLFHWLAESTHPDSLSYWPGAGVALGMLVLSVAAYGLAGQAARLTEHLGHRVLDVADLGDLVLETLLLLLQAPAIVLYATVLGRQLNA